MQVRIEGTDLPGRRWCDRDNVHVAVQRDREPEGLVPGDADAATWRFEVRTRLTDDGELDLAGPYVHGKRGDRFFYLTWGDVGSDGSFEMFRRAKLHVADISPALLTAAAGGAGLVARLGLTDGRGGPVCARVRPPAVTWTTIG